VVASTDNTPVNMTQFQFILLVFGLMAYILLTTVLYVLTSWIKNHLSRHMLIVESKTKRMEYMQSLAERAANH